jgi:hypothetical protein
MTAGLDVQPNPGDLWIVGSLACGGGKTVFLQNLAVSLAKHATAKNPSVRTLCWNTSVDFTMWKERMLKIDAEVPRLNLDYIHESWPSPSSPGRSLAELVASHRIVTIDSLDGLVPSAGIEEALRLLKYTALRCESCVVVSLSLARTDLLAYGGFVASDRAQMWFKHANRVLLTSCDNRRMTVRECGPTNEVELGVFDLCEGRMVPPL